MSKKETTIAIWQSELMTCSVKQVSDCLGDIRTIGSLVKQSSEKETLLLIENALAPALQFLNIEPTRLMIQILVNEIFDNKYYSISDLKLIQQRITEHEYKGNPSGNRILVIIQDYRQERGVEAANHSLNKHLGVKDSTADNRDYFKEEKVKEAQKANKLITKYKKTHQEIFEKK